MPKKSNNTINVTLSDDRAIALQEANFAVAHSSGELVDVEVARDVVLPLADLYFAYLQGETIDPPVAPVAAEAEAEAPAAPTGWDTVTAIRNAVDVSADQLGGHVNDLVTQGINQLAGSRSPEAVISQALDLINVHSAELGNRNAQELRRVVEGVR